MLVLEQFLHREWNSDVKESLFLGFFSKTKHFQSSPEVDYSWRRLWHFLGQLIFNRFIEFSHLGVNNSWVWVNLLSSGTYWRWMYIVISMLRHIFFIAIFMLRNRHIFYDCNCYLLYKYVNFFIKIVSKASSRCQT